MKRKRSKEEQRSGLIAWSKASGRQPGEFSQQSESVPDSDKGSSLIHPPHIQEERAFFPQR